MNILARKGHETIVIHVERLGEVTVPSTQSDGGWGQLKLHELLPNSIRHHAGRCVFINNSSRDDGIMESDWYLKRN